MNFHEKQLQLTFLQEISTFCSYRLLKLTGQPNSFSNSKTIFKMIFLLIFSCLSFLQPSELNLYNFVPGEWIQRTEDNQTFLSIIEVVDSKIENDVNYTTYSGVINGTKVTFVVDSNTSVTVTFGDFQPVYINLTKTSVRTGIYDAQLDENHYLSITIFSANAFEFSIAYPKENIIQTFGFHRKQVAPPMKPKELIFTFGIAILLTYLFHKFGGRLFG